METSSGSSVVMNQAELAARVAAKEETLRKLKLVQMYKKKWAKEELFDRGIEWKNVAQQAFTEMFNKCKNGNPELTIRKYLDHLKIMPEFIGYNVQDEEFE